MIEPSITMETFIVTLWIIFVGGGITVCVCLFCKWMRKWAMWQDEQEAQIKKMFGDDTINETDNRL